MAKPPSKNSSSSQDQGDTSISLTVEGDFNYTPNDIAELRRLADNHPELAAQIVTDKRHSHSVDQNTERLGMVVAGLLAVAMVAGAS